MCRAAARSMITSAASPVRGIVGGYLGGPGEPCPGQYYRPDNNVTAGRSPRSSPNRRASLMRCRAPSRRSRMCRPAARSGYGSSGCRVRGVIGGYPCGGPFEPWRLPRRPAYFRPNNDVTRGNSPSRLRRGGHTRHQPGETFEGGGPRQHVLRLYRAGRSRGIVNGPYGRAGKSLCRPAIAPLPPQQTRPPADR